LAREANWWTMKGNISRGKMSNGIASINKKAAVASGEARGRETKGRTQHRSVCREKGLSRGHDAMGDMTRGSELMVRVRQMQVSREPPGGGDRGKGNTIESRPPPAEGASEHTL